MQKIILSLILSLALTGCDGFPFGNNSSGSQASNRVVGDVCYSNELMCLPQLDAKNLVDPHGDYVYPEPNSPQYEKPIYVVDLKSQSLNSNISRNFKAVDYMSAIKGPYAVLSRTLVDSMQRLRDELKKSIFINSGYRSPGYNKGIPGSSRISRHTYGDAVDFYAENTSFEDLQELCEKHGASFTLIYDNHIHCDWRFSRLDTAFFPPTIDPGLHIHTHSEIAGGKINFALNQGRLKIYVEDFFTEEPGNFRYDWDIILPNGQRLESAQSSIWLNPVPGTYRISVQVGNSVQLDEILEW